VSTTKSMGLPAYLDPDLIAKQLRQARDLAHLAGLERVTERIEFATEDAGITCYRATVTARNLGGEAVTVWVLDREHPDGLYDGRLVGRAMADREHGAAALAAFDALVAERWSWEAGVYGEAGSGSDGKATLERTTEAWSKLSASMEALRGTSPGDPTPEK
jgi:hypothetical protein